MRLFFSNFKSYLLRSRIGCISFLKVTIKVGIRVIRTEFTRWLVIFGDITTSITVRLFT